jgi:hypothetical protein
MKTFAFDYKIGPVRESDIFIEFNVQTIIASNGGVSIYLILFSYLATGKKWNYNVMKLKVNLCIRSHLQTSLIRYALLYIFKESYL